MDGILTIDPTTINPTLVYLILVGSIWIGITSAYIPGTGILEVVALLGTIGSFIILSQMPTNWLAVMILVLGLSGFIIMPFIKQQYAALAVGGLLLQGVAGLLMFDGLTVSPFVIALTVVIPFAYHQWVLLPMLRNITRQPVTDRDEQLIGKRGRVVKPIDPTGTVNVESELWTATSDQKLDSGEEIVVVERRGLHLIVEPSKSKREPEDNILFPEEEDIN